MALTEKKRKNRKEKEKRKRKRKFREKKKGKYKEKKKKKMAPTGFSKAERELPAASVPGEYPSRPLPLRPTFKIRE